MSKLNFMQIVERDEVLDALTLVSHYSSSPASDFWSSYIAKLLTRVDYSKRGGISMAGYWDSLRLILAILLMTFGPNYFNLRTILSIFNSFSS